MALLVIVGLMGFGTGLVAYSGQVTTTTRSITLTNVATSTQQITSYRTTTSMIQQLGAAGLVEYAFSPGGNCAGVVVKWIGKANNTIHILVYNFTLAGIRDALIQAKNRGVEVKIVMEREGATTPGSEYANLRNAGLDVRLDTNPRTMNDNIAVIDGRIVVTGSFTWSRAANEENNENLVVLDNQVWAAAYEAQFQQIYMLAT